MNDCPVNEENLFGKSALRNKAMDSFAFKKGLKEKGEKNKLKKSKAPKKENVSSVIHLFHVQTHVICTSAV